jgi:hypothetical protein
MNSQYFGKVLWGLAYTACQHADIWLGGEAVCERQRPEMDA